MAIKRVGTINVGAIGGGGRGGLKAIGRMFQPVGQAVAPAKEALQPLGKKVKALTDDIGKRGAGVLTTQIDAGEKHVRGRLAEVLPEGDLPEPGSLNDDLSDEELEQIDTHLEGILNIVGELDTDSGHRVEAVVGAIFDACHPPKRGAQERGRRRARGEYEDNPSRLDRASRPDPNARHRERYEPRGDDQYDYEHHEQHGRGPVDVMAVDPVSGAIGMPSVRYNDDEWR